MLYLAEYNEKARHSARISEFCFAFQSYLLLRPYSNTGITLRQSIQHSQLDQLRYVTLIPLLCENLSKRYEITHYRVFLHDVTAAIMVSQNNEMAAMLVSQTNPLGVELFSYAKAYFCSNKFA